MRVARAADGDRYGDVLVDTAKSVAVYESWRKTAKPGPGPDGLRRPLWLNRPLHPAPSAYRV